MRSVHRVLRSGASLWAARKVQRSVFEVMTKHTFNDIVYVSDGKVRRADIVVEGQFIAKITDKEELAQSDLAAVAAGKDVQEPVSLLLPGVIDEHVHTREPGMTHKGDLCTETHAAAAGGVTSVLDMPNVVPQTTTLETLAQRQALGAAHAFVNHSFYFGATNSNAHLLPELDPTRVPAVKLFMGSSTGGMLVDGGAALEAVFEQSPLPIMAHCEDSGVIANNMRLAQERYGDDPDVVHHAEIRSREACIRSSSLAAQLARRFGKHLHIAHITTAEELDLASGDGALACVAGSQPLSSALHGEGVGEAVPTGRPLITLEACVPHLLFCDEDYASLGTRIKCNPAIKTRTDRDALRRALCDGRIMAVATDHAPHLLTEKQGGCKRAASGMPMVQFSLPAMLQLAEEGVLPLTQVVRLMCHNPARLFGIHGRGFIREGMKADMVLVQRQSWTLSSQDIVSRCGWSPLEGRSFSWKVAQTYCNGRLIYDNGQFMASDNSHAEALCFRC